MHVCIYLPISLHQAHSLLPLHATPFSLALRPLESLSTEFDLCVLPHKPFVFSNTSSSSIFPREFLLLLWAVYSGLSSLNPKSQWKETCESSRKPSAEEHPWYFVERRQWMLFTERAKQALWSLDNISSKIKSLTANDNLSKPLGRQVHDLGLKSIHCPSEVGLATGLNPTSFPWGSSVVTIFPGMLWCLCGFVKKNQLSRLYFEIVWL